MPIKYLVTYNYNKQWMHGMEWNGMDRYCKEVIQVSTWKHDIKVQYLYNKIKWSLSTIRGNVGGGTD